jgi:hypothetical protein
MGIWQRLFPPRPRADAKYLGVAVFERALTLQQAWAIADLQEALRRRGINPPQCGDLAIDLFAFTRVTADQIDSLRDGHVAAGHNIPDPLAGPRPRRHNPEQRLPIRVIAGCSALLSMAIVWYLSRSVSHVAWTAGILGATWTALERLRGDLMQMAIPVHRALKWPLMLLVPTSATYLLWLSYPNLFHPIGSTHPTASIFISTLWRIHTSAWVVCMAALSLMGLVAWRHREIWFMELRIDLMNGIVAYVHRALVDRNPTATSPSSRHEHIHEILKKAAHILQLNPWDRALNMTVFWRRPIGAVSLWYLEPGRDDRFKILTHVAPGAPGEVAEAFQRICERHHPVRLDERLYREAIESCRDDGHFDRQKFLSIPNRQRFISVTGFVFARRTCIVSGNSSECLAFDRSYLKALQIQKGPEFVRRWVDFQSLAAYPVFVEGPTADPRGVIVAFKNTRNGITPEDQRALAMTSRVLGVLLMSRRAAP